MGGEPLTVINCFEVPAEREREFLAIWQTFHNLQQQRPGFLANRMYRAADDSTRFRFVNVIEWESKRLYEQATTSDEFQRRVAEAGPAWDEFVRIYGRFAFIDSLSTDARGPSTMQRKPQLMDSGP